MIHDATVEVSCDHEDCTKGVDAMLHWVYMDMDGRSGFYDQDDRKIEKELVELHDWIVRDGKHFCSPECAERTEP